METRQRLVPTKETCQRLQELGVDLQTQYYYAPPGNLTHVWSQEHDWEKYVPAPLLSEVLGCMKEQEPIKIFAGEDGWHLGWKRSELQGAQSVTKERHEEMHKNKAEAACRLLIWLLENDHANPEEL